MSDRIERSVRVVVLDGEVALVIPQAGEQEALVFSLPFESAVALADAILNKAMEIALEERRQHAPVEDKDMS